jgi:hypothetical protein
MINALHPTENILISCFDLHELGLVNNQQGRAEYPRARCPVCLAEMGIRAGQVHANEHFYHIGKSNCPTKRTAQEPYLNLWATTTDRETIDRNKEFVHENMNSIWSRMREIVDYMELKEFIFILNEARRLNVYAYADLDIELIPYVYVTLANFIPSKSYRKLRTLGSRFFYEQNGNDNGELWIGRGEFPRLVKVFYRNQTIDGVEYVDTTTDYLIRAEFQLTPRQLAWCLREF